MEEFPTEHGDIVCEHVVNAGGTYARQIGEWSGLQLPMTSMTHHYLVTDTVPEFVDLDLELPVIRGDEQAGVGLYPHGAEIRPHWYLRKGKSQHGVGKITARGKPRTNCLQPTMIASCHIWRTRLRACRYLPTLGIQ